LAKAGSGFFNRASLRRGRGKNDDADDAETAG